MDRWFEDTGSVTPFAEDPTVARRFHEGVSGLTGEVAASCPTPR